MSELHVYVLCEAYKFVCNELSNISYFTHIFDIFLF